MQGSKAVSIVPNPTALDWRKRLPISVVDWIEQDLHRSFADLVRISLDAKPLPINYMTAGGWSRMSGPALTHYTFTFSDGASFETDVDPLSALMTHNLIKGYNDIISQHLWLDRYIMHISRIDNRELDYARTDIAYRIVPHLLQRGQSDPLAVCFARKLVDDTSVEDEALFMMVKMELFATKYTASQVCTAAYAAFNEIEREQS
jgi:hypothetical protein